MPKWTRRNRGDLLCFEAGVLVEAMKVSPGWIRSEEDSPKFSEPGTPDKNHEAEPPREKNSRFNARKRTTGEEALLFADEQENSLPNGTFAKTLSAKLPLFVPSSSRVNYDMTGYIQY